MLASNIAAVIHEQALLRPGSAAIITDQQVISYAELKHCVSILALHFRSRGVMPGQVVGMSMLQNPLHLMTLLALAQVGAVSLPLHPAIPAERRLLAARRFGATCVVSGRSEMALQGLAFIGFDGVSFEAGRAGDEIIFAATGETPLRIDVSSGTSGNPKGMILTHGVSALRNQTSEVSATPWSRVLSVDLNFIVGFRIALASLSRGSGLVFSPTAAAQDVMHSMITYRVTHAYLSPVQVRDILALARAESALFADIVCLRFIGGAVRSDLLQAAMEKLSPNVFVSYASTESAVVSIATPEMLVRHPGTSGRVCECATVEIVDAEGKVLPVGTTGNMRIRSSHQVSGYYRDEARNQRHFRDGWFYPGDLGHFDAEGLLYMDGRADEQINIGGMNINPEDIEATLAAHPAVMDAGVFVAMEAQGYEVSAVALVLPDATRLDEVRAYAGAKLGPLAPARYFITTTLPRTQTGKIRRAELAAMFTLADI